MLRKKAGTLSHEVGPGGALTGGGAFVKIGSSADAAVIDAAPASNTAAGRTANKPNFPILACQDVRLPAKSTELQVLALSGRNAQRARRFQKLKNVDLCQLKGQK